jgi:hypothetical protein
MKPLSVSEKVGGHVDLPMPTQAADVRTAICPYCCQPDAGWMRLDLERGRRERLGGVQYHCHAAKCLD